MSPRRSTIWEWKENQPDKRFPPQIPSPVQPVCVPLLAPWRRARCGAAIWRQHRPARREHPGAGAAQRWDASVAKSLQPNLHRRGKEKATYASRCVRRGWIFAVTPANVSGSHIPDICRAVTDILVQTRHRGEALLRRSAFWPPRRFPPISGTGTWQHLHWHLLALWRDVGAGSLLSQRCGGHTAHPGCCLCLPGTKKTNGGVVG